MMQSIMKNSIKPNILIVDDIEENMIIIEYLLDSLDVNLITAKSGAEALDKIQDTDIMLALIDVKMPEMNGFDLAELMQKNTGSELIPIIFVTAYTGDQADIEKYYRTGVVDYISKPFRNHILLSKVKVFLELYRQKLQIRNQNVEMELMFKEIRESETMYRTLLSASPQGILILNMKRLITDISNITIEIFGAGSINDFIGKDFFSIIPFREMEKLKTILSKTLSDGLVQNEEVILEKKNETPFVSEISATLIQEEDGAPKAYMII
ncbi:MAG: response regulator, partial [Prolixibacteraceae bacterium]|nr:response regulator [Prolixibacteraceae bacterium]